MRIGEDVYTIRLNNAGRIAAERFMSGGSQELKRQLNTLTPSDEAVAALLWGGSRKHHANDIRDEQDLYELLDEAEEYFGDDEEASAEQFEFPLISAYTRITERNLSALMRGEDPPDPMPGANRASRRSKKSGSSEKGKKGPTKAETQEAEAS